MKGRMGEKVLRVFNWRLTKKGDVKDLEEFQAKTVFLGMPAGDALALLVRRFNLENQVGCTLATEAEMLERLEKKGLGMTRQTLKAIRDSKAPDGTAGGERLWRSDGKYVAYNLEGMERFVRELRGK